MKLILSANDPPPYELINGGGKKSKLSTVIADSALLICDHGGKAIPQSLDNLGIAESDRDRHVTYDIGIAGVCRHFANITGLPAVIGNYSRLVIDLNRDPDDPTSLRCLYDGSKITGNFRLTDQQKTERKHIFFDPYHAEIKQQISYLSNPVIMSLHSCCPADRRGPRPWMMGILSNHDRRLADHALHWFAQNHPDFYMGDNQPYSGFDAYGYSLETHAIPQKYPQILFEIRQDLIGTDQNQAYYGGILAKWFVDFFAENRNFI